MRVLRLASTPRRGGPVALARALALAAFLAAFLAAGDAAAQTDAPEASEMPEAPAGGSVGCLDIGARAYEAGLVIRQHASALSAGFEPDARAQALQMLAWLDQWTGRLRMLVELGETGQCMDEADAETYRRAIAVASRVGNQVRDEVLRPGRASPQQQPASARPRR